MLISAPLESASRPIAEKSFVRDAERPLLDDLEQRRRRSSARSRGRDDHRGADRDQQVDRAGDREAAEQRPSGRRAVGSWVSSATLTESSKPISA